MKKKTTVYIATYGKYDDYGVIGVYSTKAKALKAAVKCQDEVYGVNEPIKFVIDTDFPVPMKPTARKPSNEQTARNA
jgi:hypothetical protein